jgi:hypothetical protein
LICAKTEFVVEMLSLYKCIAASNTNLVSESISTVKSCGRMWMKRLAMAHDECWSVPECKYVSGWPSLIYTLLKTHKYI